ncbi:SPOSA6832_01229 [Sporobolomyces salmonicolor]|uniref:SPOSA6832_01229-mRNA-1:cds n=1 Tax=Sporidiobolus salmonicolor TaxID=5005 RepID=A0A0D6EJ99_SPOSA|nr:SPOSA6832_01229 [Sporobolomyces salmonicolor]
MSAPTPDRKRKWDDPAEGDSIKAVKVEEGTTAGGAPQSSIEADKAAEAAASIHITNTLLVLAAAAIAARLASQYKPATKSESPAPHTPGLGRDLPFFKDIEINDLRNRYLLTKGPTQQQILADTGAAVLTKGVWYPDKSMATEKDPPLYLHITAENAEKLEAGVRAVQALIDQDLAPLVDQRRFGRRGDDFAPDGRDSGYGGRRKWDEEKIILDLEPLRNFNIRAKTVGPGGLFVKYIQQETQTRVQIKGIGSGYIETETGRESDDPMHINVTGPDRAMIDKAVEMAKDLYDVVKEKHAEARKMLDESMRQQQGGGGPLQAQNQQQLYGQPIHFPGAGGAGQSPYSYQVSFFFACHTIRRTHTCSRVPQPNQYAQPGLTAPLPPGEAPPPPPTDPSAQPQSDAAATAAAGAAQNGMTTEQWTAYWNSLDPASQAYYTQYYAAYAAYGANPAAGAATTAAGGRRKQRREGHSME